MERQLSIDFDRAGQLCLLKDWRPQTEGQVSGVTLKAVLGQINHYGRGRVCFVSQARLCQECGIGERTCRRAIAVLQKLGILIAIRTHAAEGTRLVVNQYRIVWSELAVIVERQGRYQPARALQSAVHVDPSATSADPTAASAVQRATSAVQRATSADQQVSCAEQRMGQIAMNQPATSADQQAIWDDQQAIWDDQQATSGRQHGITRIETKNYTAPFPPQVDPDPGGGAVDVVFEKPNRLRVHREPRTEIERLLANEGIELWARCAAEFAQLGPRVVQAAITTYRANRAKLKGPQAIVFALRNGVWPVKGINEDLSAMEQPVKKENESIRRKVQLRETLRYSIIVRGRKQKLSDHEIGRLLLAAGFDSEGFWQE